MKKSELKQLIIEALDDYLASPEGEARIGTIVIKAVDQAMIKKMRFEDGTSCPGRTVEKELDVNVLEQLVVYLARTESALRGVQSDAAQARNRAADTRNLLVDIVDGAKRSGLTLIHEQPPLKIAGKGDTHG